LSTATLTLSLQEIKARVDAACTEAGRDLGSVTLIAVSKVQPEARVETVLEAGQRIYGENRVQEAEGRWPPFIERFDGVSLHLIGPLQSNQETGRKPEIFIQVNTGEEPQKSGILPAQTDAFIEECRKMDLAPKGLMVIPPVNEEAALHFTLLRQIAERNGLSGLSMGMSADFEKAIAFGATHIRVGSAIFGERG